MEPRTVLSASIGPVPAEMTLPVHSVVIWESGPIVAARQSQFLSTGIIESYREAPKPLAIESREDAPAMLRGSEQNVMRPVFVQPQLFTHILIVEIYTVLPPLRLQGVPLQSNSPPDSIPPPLAGQSPISNTPDENHANPPISQPTNQSTNQPTLPGRGIGGLLPGVRCGEQ